MSDNAAWAIIIASMAGCTATTSYFSYETAKAKTPQQTCIERAWNQQDRIECLKTK